MVILIAWKSWRVDAAVLTARSVPQSDYWSVQRLTDQLVLCVRWRREE